MDLLFNRIKVERMQLPTNGIHQINSRSVLSIDKQNLFAIDSTTNMLNIYGSNILMAHIISKEQTIHIKHLQKAALITCSALGIEPWHARSRTLAGSPRRGLAWSWSFKELMSSHPVINTKTAPGLSFRQIWHKTLSMRLKPIESGFQQDSESRVLGLYSLKSAASSASYIFHRKQWI